MKHAEKLVVARQSENLNPEQAAFYEHLALQRVKELQEPARKTSWLGSVLSAVAWLFKKPEIHLQGGSLEERPLRKPAVDRLLL